LPFTALGQETRWGYSTTLPSPHTGHLTGSNQYTTKYNKKETIAVREVEEMTQNRPTAFITNKKLNCSNNGSIEREVNNRCPTNVTLYYVT